MATVFISYNRKSAAIAKSLAEDIEAIGYSAWYDNDLGGGQIWWDEILAHVRNCDIFVFVLDTQSLSSTACIREYGYADDLGKSILPILAAEGVSPNLLPPALSKIQFVDYRTPDRKAAFRLARAMSSIPLSKPLPEPLPLPPEVPLSYLGGLSSKVDSISPLSYEQQSAIFLDLKRSLAENDLSEDTIILLKRLRKRRDLFAAVADDVDDLLEQLKIKDQRNSISIPQTESLNKNYQARQTPEVDATSETTEEAGINIANDIVMVKGDTNPSMKQRIRAILILIAIGVCGSILNEYLRFGGHSLLDTFFVFVGSLLAGVIGGINRGPMIGAIIFLCIMFLLMIYIINDWGIMYYHIGAMIFPSLGALIGMFIQKSTGKPPMHKS